MSTQWLECSDRRSGAVYRSAECYRDSRHARGSASSEVSSRSRFIVTGISDYAESEGEATATVSFILEPPRGSPAGTAWRRIVPPTPRDVVKGGKNFQDLVGSYLCRVGLVVLNRRHLAKLPEVEPADLTNFLILVADEVFSECYNSESPGAAHVAKRFRLHGSKLIDSMPGRALWIVEHWDRHKIEGRRRGGRHGAAQGVRKGPPPGLVPGLIGDFIHLPPGERKRAFTAAHPCSDSTFYKLQRQFIERLNARKPHVLDQAYLLTLLPDSES